MLPDILDRALGGLVKIVCGLVYVALTLPAIVVVATSFTSGDEMRFPPSGLSLRWYSAFWESSLFIDSLALSLKLATIATVLSLLIGFAAALAIERHSQTFVGLVIGHVVVTLPFVVRTLSASMVLFDQDLEQAAMSLRAKPMKVLRTITIPLLAPGIISAGVFAFVTSFANVNLSVFLGAGGNVTLPVQVLAYVEQTFDPLVAAVSSVVIVITLVAILIADRLSGPRSVI
ncbi:putative spermidine/putrescine transport system permease protein [Bradyrhizobium sp. JR1.5]|uniref:ABC transporter permease n=1 Tax=unclassified Bradyrhizobium TaxID=2631580 RepID=UPI00339A0A51